jgi:hypothetical protein
MGTEGSYIERADASLLIPRPVAVYAAAPLTGVSQDQELRLSTVTYCNDHNPWRFFFLKKNSTSNTIHSLPDQQLILSDI